ncbi:MAG: sugar ABC transporter ATP-binding protein [Nocardioidaceae bacterium]
MHLRLDGVRKSFADNPVLRGVDLDIRGGEVLALLGENGAGKSTLTRVVSGVHEPDGGRLLIDGEAVDLTTPVAAMERGIQVIYQEFRHNLFPHMSVAENLYMREEGREFGSVMVSKRAMAKAAAAMLERLDVTLDPYRAVGTLSVAEQQMVVIAKAMTHHPDVLILDEPTAALNEHEAEQLFIQVCRLRDDGVAIVYISHRLDEVFRLADSIVVLRDGVVALTTGPDATPRDVVNAMVGHDVDDFYPKERHTRDEIVLSVRDLAVDGEFGDVSFDVRAGEVLGLAGVLGSGRTSVVRSLFATPRPSGGRLELDGQAITPATPVAAMRAGIAYLTADRGAEGLATGLSVRHNVSLPSLAMRGRSLGFVPTRQETKDATAVVERLSVVMRSLDQSVDRLSGGNQQKLLFGKWMLTGPRVLLLDEPTRGVDVAAKTEIYHIINDLAASGVAIVLVSSDLPELVNMSDRVLVMRGGELVAELQDEAITQQNVLAHSMEGAA